MFSVGCLSCRAAARVRIWWERARRSAWLVACQLEEMVGFTMCSLGMTVSGRSPDVWVV